MTAGRRLLLVYAALACAATSEFFCWVWTPAPWLTWLTITAPVVIAVVVSSWMAVRSCP